MARLERVTHKLFAENAPIVESGTTSVEIGQFGSALAGTYVATNDVATLQALPAYTRGWGGAVIADEQLPTLEDMNAVQRVQSYQTGYLFQEGIPEYDANATYYIGSIVKQIDGNDFKLYSSVTNDNMGNPLTDTNNWSELVLDGANINLSNLSETGEKHFLNKTQITNCILEAPNNYLTVSGNTITVKAGLKYLSANGRNTDETLKNIETVLSEDVSVTLSTSATSDRYLIGNSAGSIIFWWDGALFEQEDEPDVSTATQYSQCLWYRPSTNIWYILPQNSTAPYNWTPTANPCCVLAFIGRNGTTSIRTVERRLPFRAVDYNDKAEITGWAFPSDKYTSITVGTTGSLYTAPANGWFTVTATELSDYGALILNNDTTKLAMSHIARYASGYYSLNIPVKKGDKVKFTYPSGASITYFRFVYAEGAE